MQKQRWTSRNRDTRESTEKRSRTYKRFSGTRDKRSIKTYEISSGRSGIPADILDSMEKIEFAEQWLMKKSSLYSKTNYMMRYNHIFKDFFEEHGLKS